MITINKELCIACSSCIQDCPVNNIILEDSKATPRRDCMQCGHCVAICPVNAVSIPDYDMSEVEEYTPETFTISPENYLHAVKFRRSIRNFTQQPLSRETLTDILNTGRYTATAKNMQDCRFVLVQEKLEEFKELVWKELPSILEILEIDRPQDARTFRYFYKKHQENPAVNNFFFNCTAFLAIACDYPLDAGLAAANIENMAAAKGVGSLYSGFLQRVISSSPALKEWLGIGEKQLTCCMLLGYPNVKFHRTAPRKKADIIWK